MVDYHPLNVEQGSLSDPQWLALNDLSVGNETSIAVKHFIAYSNSVAEFLLSLIKVIITSVGLNTFEGKVTHVQSPVDMYLLGSTVAFVRSNIFWKEKLTLRVEASGA